MAPDWLTLQAENNWIQEMLPDWKISTQPSGFRMDYVGKNELGWVDDILAWFVTVLMFSFFFNIHILFWLKMTFLKVRRTWISNSLVDMIKWRATFVVLLASVIDTSQRLAATHIQFRFIQWNFFWVKQTSSWWLLSSIRAVWKK